jgi:hypothetical protein
MIQIGLHGGGRVSIAKDGRIDVSQVTPEVLAFGLSHVTRFGGQAGPYSVGEHSVRMYEWAKQEKQDKAVLRAILIHDAPECLGEGDHQRFVKRAFFSDGPKKFADLVCGALWDAYHPADRPLGQWSWRDMHDALKPYDEWIGTVEATTFGFPHDTLPEYVTVPGIARPLFPMKPDPEWWEAEYMRCWRESG